MRIRLIKLEAIATIAWFLTDMCWMWGCVALALLMLPVIIIPMIITYIRTTSQTIGQVLVVSFLWLTMNTLWMTSDLFTNPDQIQFVLALKLLGTGFGVMGMMHLVYYFIVKKK